MCILLLCCNLQWVVFEMHNNSPRNVWAARNGGILRWCRGKSGENQTWDLKYIVLNHHTNNNHFHLEDGVWHQSYERLLVKSFTFYATMTSAGWLMVSWGKSGLIRVFLFIHRAALHIWSRSVGDKIHMAYCPSHEGWAS